MLFICCQNMGLLLKQQLPSCIGNSPLEFCNSIPTINNIWTKIGKFWAKIGNFQPKIGNFFQQIHCGWVTQPKIGLDEALRPTYLVAYLPSGLSISLFIYRPIYIGLAFYRPSFLSAYLSIGLSIQPLSYLATQLSSYLAIQPSSYLATYLATYLSSY